MSIGRLRRHLDEDLIARVQAGTVFKPKPLKHLKPPRAASTYRAARRNALKRPRTSPEGEGKR